jgi:SAM-dependent methyltransferase
MTEWARDYYERGYAQRWTLGPPSAETQREADTLCAQLRLTSSTRVLDVGCGHGRSAVALAQRGVDVTGIDFAAYLLARAQELAKAFDVRPSWVRGDMRCLPFRPESMQAAMLKDAYGFFDSEEENERVLRELARVLIPDGRVALKVANAEPILTNFRPTAREQRGDTTIEIERRLLADPPRLVEDLFVAGSGGSGRYQRRQRLDRAAEVTAQLEAAGLAVIELMASIAGAPFDPSTSSAMVVVAERRVA